MIPLKLQLKNFLSYGPEVQTIDFTPYNLICLSGKNGHGKSALLDAITWALWGYARKTTMSSKPDANLLHLGQTFMMVGFDFEFNGQTYRIKREFGKTYGKPYAQLEFGLLNKKSNTIIPLTDKTIKKTQQKIEETLRLDFESFVNSAFLRQGSANEFSQKNPKERKEILASILGLNHYDELRRRAMDKVKLAMNTKTAHLAISEKIQQELNAQTDLDIQLATLQKNLEEIGFKEVTAEQHKQLLESESQKLRTDQQAVELLTFKQQQLSKNHNEHIIQLREAVTAWRTIHRKKLTLPSTEQLDSLILELNANLKQEQQKLQQSLTIKEAILKHKEELHRLTQQLQEQYQIQLQEQKIISERSKIELANIVTKEKEIKEDTARTQSELAVIAKEQIRLTDLLSQQETHTKETAKIESQFDKRKTFYQSLVAQGNLLSAELTALQHKDNLVHDEQDPSCPLCEQNLSSSRKKFLKTKFALQHQFLTHQVSRIRTLLAKLKPMLVGQHEQLKTAQNISAQFGTYALQLEEARKNGLKYSQELQKLAAHLTTMDSIVAQLNKQLKTTQLTIQQLEQTKSTSLDSHESYRTLTQQINSLEQQVNTIKYDNKQHLAFETQLSSLDKQRSEIIALQQEVRGQAQRAESINHLCVKLRAIKIEQNTLQKEIQQFELLPMRQKELNEQATQFNYQLKELITAKEMYMQEKGKLHAHKQKLEQLAQEYTQEQARMSALNQTISDYQAIASATGKDGIQALLIEEAIPEIEQEANILLAKLTNNQAQLFLESLRDLKSGGTKETLDINISDPAGIRAYEMFSGGEAFRIDFALRIAISKLLARRAGTALQTLIIDEGFGSQDEEGLGFIMDALYKIQDDFAKIIIVSHLPSMKDQFPVHFVVEKKPQGSVVKTMEQG